MLFYPSNYCYSDLLFFFSVVIHSTNVMRISGILSYLSPRYLNFVSKISRKYIGRRLTRNSCCKERRHGLVCMTLYLQLAGDI
uniref:Uncharacterized protein n=1 Tax=Aegilops tauschii subsp. strangulata TaxID=200361 RepID=A0A453AY33_AEGTS